jgi:hypothetical protein
MERVSKGSNGGFSPVESIRRSLRLPRCRSAVEGLKHTFMGKQSTSTPVRSQNKHGADNTAMSFTLESSTVEQGQEMLVESGVKRMSISASTSDNRVMQFAESYSRSRFSVSVNAVAGESFHLDMTQPLDLSIYSASSECSFTNDSPWKRHSMVEFGQLDNSLDSNCSVTHDESESGRQKLMQKLRRRSDALKMKNARLKDRYARLKERQKSWKLNDSREGEQEKEAIRYKNERITTLPPRGRPPLPNTKPARPLSSRFDQCQLPRGVGQSTRSTSTAGCTPWPEHANGPYNNTKSMPQYRGIAPNMTLELELIKQSISKTKVLVSDIESSDAVMDFSMAGGRNSESELVNYPVTFLKNGKKCTWC